MPIQAPIDGSATISTTEFSLPNGSTTLTPQTTACVLTPTVDFSALAAGDQYRIRIYEKVNGVQQIWFEGYVTGKQSQSYVCPTFDVSQGWDVTVLKVTGTDRAIAWTLREVG